MITVPIFIGTVIFYNISLDEFEERVYTLKSNICGYNSSVECDLPKVDRWVRLPLPAP